MMTLPAALAAKLKSNDLRGIKPIILMYRNKWDAQANTFVPETTPIDITEQVIKCGTLSTKLDVGEINEYTASNVTLTLSDPHNHFVEGTPKSYFPDGYQIYGTRIELYAGTDTNNMTPLFYGVIRSLPNHKPEEYQLDISVVSALELLDDVEAKDFSTPYTGEKLTLDHRDDDAGPVYRTANTGVGGFNAVYANGSVLVEGVDYEVSRLSENTLPALVEITNKSYFSSTITADYYVWKKNLAVEEIVKGVLELAGYQQDELDIQPVAWENAVRSSLTPNVIAALEYIKQEKSYIYKGSNVFWGNNGNYQRGFRQNILPENFDISFNMQIAQTGLLDVTTYMLGDVFEDASSFLSGGYDVNGIVMQGNINSCQVAIRRGGNILWSHEFYWSFGGDIIIQKRGNSITFVIGEETAAANVELEEIYGTVTEYIYYSRISSISNYNLTPTDNNGVSLGTLSAPGIITEPEIFSNHITEFRFLAELSNAETKYSLMYRVKNNDVWEQWKAIDMGVSVPKIADSVQFILSFTPPINSPTDITDITIEYLSSQLSLQIINLTDQSVLEVIEDLALITGYEFGIDRNGIFFFRPRQTSTQPIATLDKFELVKIDTVTRNFNELATKLTLTFAAAPLEFYANTGARPTPVDKYGVIDKEIDKPQLINYDNPELAQAIGPQLLAIYSELPNIITCTGKLNLALELGDIVNLKREMPLTINPEASDYTKYEGLNTFYRACKITGLNYDFTKRQIKYTLRDVSNDNNAPVKDYYEYQTIFPTPLDYKE